MTLVSSVKMCVPFWCVWKLVRSFKVEKMQDLRQGKCVNESGLKANQAFNAVTDVR